MLCRIPGARPLACGLARGGTILHEPVEPFAVADQAVSLPRETLDGGGVIPQRILTRAQCLDLGPVLLQPQLLRGLLAADAAQLEVAVIPAEQREVEGAGEEDQADDEAQLQKASAPR